jgi:hypothetical protein
VKVGSSYKKLFTHVYDAYGGHAKKYDETDTGTQIFLDELARVLSHFPFKCV